MYSIVWYCNLCCLATTFSLHSYLSSAQQGLGIGSCHAVAQQCLVPGSAPRPSARHVGAQPQLPPIAADLQESKLQGGLTTDCRGQRLEY